MANKIVSVHAGIYGIGINAIILPSGGFSVAHFYRLQATYSSARSLVSIEKSQGFQTVRCLIGC